MTNTTPISHDEWLAMIRLQEEIAVACDVHQLISATATRRVERILLATEAMCVECERAKIDYKPLRELITLLNDPFAAINIEPGKDRIFAAARRVGDQLQQVRGEGESSPPPQVTEGQTRPRRVSEAVQVRRQAILKCLPRSNQRPLKNQSELARAITRALDGLRFDPSTISRALKDLREQGLVEHGMVRLTPEGDRKAP